MTTANLCTYIALFVTLLIVGLMLYLRQEFKKIGLQSWIADYQKEKKQGLFNNDLPWIMITKTITKEELQEISNRRMPMFLVKDGAEDDEPAIKIQPKRRKYRDNPQRGK